MNRRLARLILVAVLIGVVAAGTTPATVPATAPAAAPATVPASAPAAAPATVPATVPATPPAAPPAGPPAGPPAAPPTAPPAGPPAVPALSPAVPYGPLAPAAPLANNAPNAPVVATAPGAAVTETGVRGNTAVVVVSFNSVGGKVITVQSVENDPAIKLQICEDLLTASAITGWTSGNSVSVFAKCTINGVTNASAHKFSTLAVAVQATLDAGSPQAAQDAIRQLKSAAADGVIGTSAVGAITGAPAIPAVPTVATPTAPPTAPSAGATANIDVTITTAASTIDAAGRTNIANQVTTLLALAVGQGLVNVTSIDAATVARKFTNAADGALVHLRIHDPASATPQAIYNKFDQAMKANGNKIGVHTVNKYTLVTAPSPSSSAWCQPAFLVAVLAMLASVMLF